MVYATDANKWRAYQFLDPFAAGSFYVCNKVSTIFCNPDCDAHPTTELRLEIKFVETAAEALSYGYVPCKTCDPVLVPNVDVNLLLKTVRSINASIGFIPPLLDDDEDKVAETIKENIIGQGSSQRRMLVPNISTNSKFSGAARGSNFSVSKNDSEHYRLIDLACRHLALAAATSIFSTQNSGSGSPKSDDSQGKKKGDRKRRGGVLGFKELATKSKLSAWHFHRVFKSIIGLTPKTYGDMCWEFLEREKEAQAAAHDGLHADAAYNALPLSKTTPLNETYTTPKPTSVVASPVSGQKRARIDEDSLPSPKRNLFDATPEMIGFDFLDENLNMSSRAISAPNLAAYGAASNSLFQHQRVYESAKDLLPTAEPHFGEFNDASGLNFSKYPVDLCTDVTPVNLSNDLSPVTVSTDISPVTAAEYPTDLSLSMFEMQDMQHDMGFPTDMGFGESSEWLSGAGLMPELKHKPELPADNDVDPLMVCIMAPESMASNIGL